jgi:antitoxin component of MazEF toxin-antitoxin module
MEEDVEILEPITKRPFFRGKVSNVGGSFILTIPKSIARDFEIDTSNEVEVMILKKYKHKTKTLNTQTQPEPTEMMGSEFDSVIVTAFENYIAFY